MAYEHSISLVLSSYALGLGACATSIEGVRSQADLLPTQELVERIEKAISMPRGAQPLDRYVRYYTSKIEGGERFIYGAFFNKEVAYSFPAGTGVTDVRIVSPGHIPTVYGGGCDNIELRVHAETLKIQIKCEG
jgi:hypothetical protein